MANKFNRSHLAPGQWASSWRYVQAQQVPEKVRVWLQDKLVTRGRWVDLYLPVAESTAGAVACTCTKNTTDSSDRSCITCFGTKYAPGYQKFLHQTQFWCSAEYANFTLDNTTISTAKKANIITLVSGQTLGFVETDDKSYENEVEEDWEVKLDAYRRAAGSSFILEFSIDAGTSWTTVPLSEVDSPGLGFTGTISGADLAGTGSVRFRITLGRNSASDLTPAFEILRIRRVMSENENQNLIRQRPDHVSGSILVLRPWVIEQDSIEPGRGRLVEHLNAMSWTSPLDFFDTSLTHDTPDCRIQDHLGPHAFYEMSSGVQEGTRYALTKVSYNDNFGVFTQQHFDDRRTQPGEPYWHVW